MIRRIIFVTGGAGFIGSNIVATLAEDRDLDVVVCDRLHEVELGKWRNIAKHPLGDFVHPDQMFDWLERAHTEHDPGLTQLLLTPFILNYRDDPRFAAFCQKLRLQVPPAAITER